MKAYNIDLTVRWIPREQNLQADKLSKYVDVDDWATTEEFFTILSQKWGPYTIDRFANSENKKLGRFNSRFFCHGSAGVDAFSQNWEGANNYIVPPIRDIIAVIDKISTKHVTGVLVTPYWVSGNFWALLLQGGDSKNSSGPISYSPTGNNGYGQGIVVDPF